MKTSDIITKLIFLPNLFDNLENVSIYDLLEKTGYFQMYEQISEKNIRKELTRHPECVAEWILYSENKRSSSGFYVKQENEHTYIVGYFNGKNQKHIQTSYTDRMNACAAFIKNEIEEIRLSM